MKLRTTTPASISRKTRRAKSAFIVTMALLLALTSTVTYFKAQPVSADQYDDKINALQQSMAQYQAAADSLNAEATTLANALAQITNEKNALQAQVDLSQAQYDKLVVQIADTEKQIKDNQDALGTTITSLYIDDTVSPVEMLASSQNIGDYIDKQEYRNSVKDQLSVTIKKVQTLKEQLGQQKADVQKVLNEQKTARDSYVAKEAEQANVLAKTKNDEATYQGLIKDSASQIADAKAAQAVLRARTNSTGGYSLVDAGSLGAYGWNDSTCPMWGYLSTGGADGNGSDGRGYGCRQCASYAAWRIAKETGVYYQWGNGGNFASAAISAGYQNLGRSPQPGSIAVILGNPGHVAWVEAVNGNQVLVSQYNYNYGAGWGMYSEMWLSVNFFDQYVKIK
jgi:surface antigen